MTRNPGDRKETEELVPATVSSASVITRGLFSFRMLIKMHNGVREQFA